MKAFIWDQSFVTGVERVDEQHHFLVDLINRFGESLIASKSVGDAELAVVFGELADYAKYHFSTEESLMLECGVSPRHRDLHIQQHANFLSQVTSMWNGRSSMGNPAEVLHGFLCAWLAFHVLGEDQHMGRQIALIRAGKATDEAFDLARKPIDNSTAGLLTALQNLYGVLTEQNQNLASINARLGERVKELRCLHAVAAMMAMADMSAPDILGAAVELIPPGWFYPEIACARIVFEGREFLSRNFRETSWKLGADIVVGGVRAGTLEVCYLEEKPALDEGPFLREELVLVNTLASQFAGMAERKRAEEQVRDYVARLEHSVLGTVDAVSQMMDVRDPYTSGHMRRVGEVAAAIAAEMGLHEHVQRGLRVAGAVHDVGKIAVPAEILGKPGRISDIELEMVRTHAQEGYEVLKGIDFPWPVAEVARQHHERIDGSGYPRALKGDQILLEARVLAVADVIEAMASHRPYRAGIGLEKALAEVERGRGTIYDASAADACLRLFRDKGYALPV